MELTWGTDESEAKDRNSWRKRNGCIILNGLKQQKEKKFAYFIYFQQFSVKKERYFKSGFWGLKH